MRPPIDRPGLTTHAAAAVARLMPPHQRYIDLFPGALALLLAKPPSSHEIVNDLDGDVAAFWQILRDEPDWLIRACHLTPHSRAGHTHALKRDAETAREKARHVWVALEQSTPSGNWNPTATRVTLDTTTTGLPAAAERLRDVTLEHGDPLDLLDSYGADPATLIHVDLAASPGHQSLDYQDLLAAGMRHCAATVMLSADPAVFQEQLITDWHRIRLENSHPTVWSNHPIDAEPALFDLTGERTTP